MSVTCWSCASSGEAAVDADDGQADVVQPVDRDEQDEEQRGEERDHARVAALLDDLGGALLGQADRVRLFAAKKRSPSAPPAAVAGRSRLARRNRGRRLFGPRRQLATGPVVGHMQPWGERAGIRPGWPRATGSGPSVILDVSTVSTPPLTMCANRSSERGAGPSSLILMPTRS